MKFGHLATPGRLEVIERPEPQAGPGEVVVSLAACGVCGTDLEKLRGNYQTAGVIGHEPVGRIARVAPDVRGLSVGDRVFVHHHVPCYSCEVCARGDTTFCPTYSKTNLDPGGFADAFRVPAENVSRGAVLPLAASVDSDTGSLLEPAGCALTALRRTGLPKGATVFILGLGPVGLLYGRIARSLGADWVGGSEVAPLRRRVAERGGMNVTVDPREEGGAKAAVDRATQGRGVDLAVVATGHPSGGPRRDAPGPARGHGESLRPSGAGSRLDADLQDLYLRGVRILPSYATTEPDIAEVHRRVVAGELELRDLVTHHLPLDQLAEAFRLAGQPAEAVKVVVTGPAAADENLGSFADGLADDPVVRAYPGPRAQDAPSDECIALDVGPLHHDRVLDVGPGLDDDARPEGNVLPEGGSGRRRPGGGGDRPGAESSVGKASLAAAAVVEEEALGVEQSFGSPRVLPVPGEPIAVDPFLEQPRDDLSFEADRSPRGDGVEGGASPDPHAGVDPVRRRILGFRLLDKGGDPVLGAERGDAAVWSRIADLRQRHRADAAQL